MRIRSWTRRLQTALYMCWLARWCIQNEEFALLHLVVSVEYHHGRWYHHRHGVQPAPMFGRARKQSRILYNLLLYVFWDVWAAGPAGMRVLYIELKQYPNWWNIVITFVMIAS
jgi:hypothetical protein